MLPPSERSRAAALWELVDAGAGFEETLDALISSGLRGLPELRAGEPRRATRPRCCCAAASAPTSRRPDDVVHLDGAGATTWVERTLTGVTRIRLEVAEEPGADDLVVSRRAGADLDGGPAADRGGAGATDRGAGPCDRHRAAAIEPDGDTRAGGVDPATLGTPLPGIPGQPPAPPVTARPVARLVLPEGEPVDVDRIVLVGRAPEVRHAPGPELPHLIPVPSPHHEISSTHLEVRPGSGADHGSAVVTDLGSTNGTLLVQPGMPPEDLKPGVGVQLLPGAVLDLGDGVIIQVVTP